mmetsp:Transcript_134723/g.430429  ORF Transcript_134723/g.430429 Transcript_134723/m.430429 type:complete len:219 (-) Transcript_134723:3565-4221(-)
MLERQDDLTNAGDTRRTLQVAHVRLGGRQGQRPSLRATLAVDCLQSTHLDRVSQSRTRTVALNACHILTQCAPLCQSTAQHALLRCAVRRSDRRGTTVVVRRDASEHGDRRCVGGAICGRLDVDATETFASGEAVGASIEGLTAAVEGQTSHLGEADPNGARDLHVDACRDGALALAEAHGLATRVERDDGRRARGVDGEARAAQREHVGNTSRATRV